MGQVIVAPGGAIDVLYQDYAVLNRKTLKLGSGIEDFTTSTDRGKTWSAPVHRRVVERRLARHRPRR